MTEQEKLAEKREKRAVYNRKYYEANKDWLKALPSQNHRNRTGYYLQRRFGISKDQFDGMLSAQNAACAICCTTEPKGSGAFHVDHCHSSGVVRGLLCHSCNVGLGHFRDDTALLLRATEYLDAARTP